MRIEADAAQIYTLAIYYKVREEIKSACYHTSMPDMTRDNETRHFICKDDILDGKLFEVWFRQSDNYVQCNCKLYFRRGYLCRHAFAALQQCGIHTIPRQFVKPRWTKNAVRIHSTLGSSEPPTNNDKCNMTKQKRARAWFEFHNCMNYADQDEDMVDTVMRGLQEISSKLQKKGDSNEVQDTAQRAEKFIGPVPQDESSIQNPLTSRNKGCGSRIKSSKEISIKKKQHTCSTCNKTEGHNARTCPHSK